MQPPPVTRFGLAHKWRAFRQFAVGIPRVRREAGVGALAQLAAYRAFRSALRITPQEFYRYELWDDTRPRSERLKFLSWHDRRRLEEFFNARTDVDLVRSKLRSDEFCRTHDLPTPARLAIWNSSTTSANDPGRVISTPVELHELIEQHPEGLVCKRDYGGGGEQVVIFVAADATGLSMADGTRWSVAQLVERMSGPHRWLLQARVMPHPELLALSGSADGATTVRIVTCLRSNGDVTVLPATLKLPDHGSGLDNFGAGNPAVAVSEGGVLGAACHGIDGPVIDRHPTTGLVFSGVVLPDWDAAVALAKQGQQLLPTLRSIGWDIALSAGGPLIVEPNDWWSSDVVQQPGLRGLVDDPFVEFVTEVGARHLLHLDRRQAR
ncbi:MAG: sugar-transfer associated ATP-grasp domain-containing protein [Gemmatimonadota bacterium]